MKVVRCGDCRFCEAEKTIRKSIDGYSETVNICEKLRVYVEKDDGCTFGVEKGEDA